MDLKIGDIVGYKNTLLTVKEIGPFNVLCTFFKGDQLMQIKLPNDKVDKLEVSKTKAPYLLLIQGGKNG